jgi:hypothetical protein
VVCLASAGLAAVTYSSESGGPEGAFVALLIGGLPFLLLAGAGGLLFWRGGKETAEIALVEKQKKVLNMVKTQGQVDIREVALELGASLDDVRNMIHDLVGKELFHGYIHWDDGTLYSQEASAMQGRKTCPNCGGEQEFVGRGVIQCRHCGAQIFL